jgi:uncharacterized tellurite resistance protein B-like protein
MELLIGIAVIYGFFKLVSKLLGSKKSPATAVEVKRRTSSTSTRPPKQDISVTITIGSGLDEQPEISDQVTSDDCWVEPGRSVTVAGYTIPNGMIYLGKGLASVSGIRIEPALINPSLAVDRSNPDRSGSGMGYWPSYSAIPNGCRAAYLEWLSSDRRTPGTYIGYVFLFLYGLERRAVADAPRSEAAKRELPAILCEAEALLRVYGENKSFRRYAADFVDVLKVLVTDNATLIPPVARDGYDLPTSVRVGVGRFIAEGRPIPPEWAYGWYLTHPETVLRTSAKRCGPEFRDLFCARYTKEFGDGLIVKPGRTKLNLSLRPASASFGGNIPISLDLPDIAWISTPISKFRKIADSCEADLDAFSRWVGRNPAASRTVAAVALLPAELTTKAESAEAQSLWKWIHGVLDVHDRAVCKANDILQHCPLFGEGKLAKGETVLLAQLLEKGGYGVEPDVRFGGPPLAPDSAAVIFKLPPDALSIASPQYAAATLLLHLAVAIAAADGSISTAEETHLQNHLQRALHLSEAERHRLSAHMAWLLTEQPGLTGLKKRIEALDEAQRSALADFVVSIAGADGQISPDEIRTLSKVYPMLGFDSQDVYSHIHAMTAGRPRSSDPVTVIPAKASKGYSIPRPPEPKAGADGVIQLDMDAVKEKLAQSAQISAILGNIFVDDTVVQPVAPPSLITNGKLGKYSSFVSQLSARSEWSRDEFEALAAEFQFLPDAAFEAINEVGFEIANLPVVEGDDPLYVDVATAKELLT